MSRVRPKLQWLKREGERVQAATVVQRWTIPKLDVLKLMVDKEVLVLLFAITRGVFKAWELFLFQEHSQQKWLRLLASD